MSHYLCVKWTVHAVAHSPWFIPGLMDHVAQWRGRCVRLESGKTLFKKQINILTPAIALLLQLIANTNLLAWSLFSLAGGIITNALYGEGCIYMLTNTAQFAEPTMSNISLEFTAVKSQKQGLRPCDCRLNILMRWRSPLEGRLRGAEGREGLMRISSRPRTY